MNSSTSEEQLRIDAARSSLASVRLSSLEPSTRLERLLAAWSKDEVSLGAVRDELIEQWRMQND